MAQSTVEYTENAVLDQVQEAPIRILHVDDEVDFLETSQQILEMQGVLKVDTAVSVEDAKEKMQTKTYDAIICDYIMPTKDGLQFLKEVRDSDNNIPFIIFTGKGREDVAIEALNLGADQYFSKIGSPETVYGELSHGIRQVVERNRAHEALIESEEKWRTLAEQSPNMVFINKKGKVTYANKKCEELMGYQKEEFYSPNFDFSTLIAPESIDSVNAAFRKHMKGEEVPPYEYTLIAKEGKRIEAILTTKLIRYEGEPAILGTVTDITKRKKAEERLRSSEERYKALFELAPDAIVIYDPNGIITSCNTAAAALSGSSKDEIIGRPFTELGFCQDEDIPKYHEMFRSILEGKPTEPFEVIWLNRDGTVHTSEVRAVLLKDETGVLGVQAVIRDITERRKTEKALTESQEKFERVFVGNPEASAYVDSTFHILDVNPRFEELFGYLLDEVKGKHINDVIVPEDKMKEAETLDKKAKKGYVYHDTVRKRKDGSLVQVSIAAAPVVVEGRCLEYVAVYKDISQLKMTEKELDESRRHFQALFNAIVDPVVIVDGKGNFLEITDRVEKITGFKREELIGKNFLRTKIVTAKSKAILVKALAKRMIGIHVAPYTVEVVTKDGSKLPYEVNAAKIEYKGKPADLVVFRDVSERKKTMEKLKVLNEKLAVVGKLTRHDVRNKLMRVTGNIYLARHRLDEGHDALKYLAAIDPAVQEIERIFHFARTYEKLGVEELGSIDVEKTVKEAVSLFSDLHGVKVVNDCHGLTVLADSLLRHLFYNLIDNSLRHGEKVSQIRVYCEELGKNQLKLIYEDDGVGIPKTEKEKIFEEGYGKDSGYGLYLIEKMCEVYGWNIRETGKQGKGARFTITISSALHK